MASSGLFQLPKAKHGEKWAYSPEIQQYAAYALEHLFELAAILKHQTDAQSEAFESGEANNLAAKESIALTKTTLNLYKQIDRYMAILHPPVIEEEGDDADLEVSSATMLAMLKQELAKRNQKAVSNPLPQKSVDSDNQPREEVLAHLPKARPDQKKSDAQTKGQTTSDYTGSKPGKHSDLPQSYRTASFEFPDEEKQNALFLNAELKKAVLLKP